MQESYHVQPIRLGINNLPYPPENGINATQIERQLVKLKGETCQVKPSKLLVKES